MTPDQPTGMNELREITDKFLADCELISRDYIREEIPAERAKVEIETAQEEAEALIQQLVERCIPPKQDEHPIDPETGAKVETYGYEEMYNQLIDQFRHNFQQAGLLRGDEFLPAPVKNAQSNVREQIEGDET